MVEITSYSAILVIRNHQDEFGSDGETLNDVIEKALAQDIQRDRVATAAEARGTITVAPVEPRRSEAASSGVVIRYARPGDATKLADLGRLDADLRTSERLARLAGESAQGRVLVADVEGELAAALVVDDGQSVADPFRPSAGFVELLRTRADQLAAPRVRARRSFIPSRASVRLRLH
jgi:hypothetical protein